MAINRYTNRIPYEGELSSPPVDMIAMVLDQAQQRYDTNFQLSEKIKNRYVNALPKDRAAADEIQTQTETRIDGIVAKYSGDYSQASKDLYRLMGDIEKDYNPGGRAHAIESHYLQYNESMKREREKLEKGKIIAAQISALRSHVDRTYPGIGEKDPDTGMYNQLDMPDLAEYVDANKILQTAFDKTPESKQKVGQGYFKNGNQYYEETEQIGKPYERLRDNFSNALFGDTAYTTYMDQLSYLAGEPLTNGQFEDRILSIADTEAQARAYLNTTGSQKVERDPLMLKNLDHQNRMKEIGYRQKLKDASDKETMGNLFGALNIGQGLNRRAGQELSKNWRAPSSGFSKPQDGGTMGMFPGFSEASVAANANMYEAISSGKIKESAPGTNTALVMAGARKLASEQGFNFDKQSESWKANFFNSNEQDIIGQYNRDIKNVEVGIADEFAIPTVASKNLKNQLIPAAMAGDASVFQVKNGNITEFQKLSDLGIEDDIFTENGAIKAGVQVTDYVVPGMGYSKPAFKVVTPSGKSFFITDQNKDRYEFFSQFGDAHSGIWNEGREWGTKFGGLTDSDSNPVEIVPRMKYVYDKDKPVRQVMEYHKINSDGISTSVIAGPSGGVASTYDMWNLMQDRIEGALPLGAPASAKAKFIYDYMNQQEDEE